MLAGDIGAPLPGQHIRLVAGKHGIEFHAIADITRQPGMTGQTVFIAPVIERQHDRGEALCRMTTLLIPECNAGFMQRQSRHLDERIQTSAFIGTDIAQFLDIQRSAGIANEHKINADDIDTDETRLSVTQQVVNIQPQPDLLDREHLFRRPGLCDGDVTQFQNRVNTAQCRLHATDSNGARQLLTGRLFYIVPVIGQRRHQQACGCQSGGNQEQNRDKQQPGDVNEFFQHRWEPLVQTLLQGHDVVLLLGIQ